MNHVPVPPQDQEAQKEEMVFPCWYCESLEQRWDSVFSREWDCPVHLTCIRDAFTKDPADEEALVFARELLGFDDGARWQKSRELPTHSQTEEEMAYDYWEDFRLRDAWPDCTNEYIYVTAFKTGLWKGAEAEREKLVASELGPSNASMLCQALNKAKDEIASLKAELEEQCRINGMGAQRELRLKTLLGEATSALEKAKFLSHKPSLPYEKQSGVFGVLDEALKAIRASSGPKEGKDV